MWVKRWPTFEKASDSAAERELILRESQIAGRKLPRSTEAINARCAQRAAGLLCARPLIRRALRHPVGDLAVDTAIAFARRHGLPIGLDPGRSRHDRVGSVVRLR